MKRTFLSSSKAWMAFMIVCSGMMLLASCSKKNDIQPEPVGELDFKAVNTVPDSKPQDILINGAVKVTALGYGSSSAYFKMISGLSNLGFFDTGTTAQANVGGSIELPIGAKISGFYYKKSLGGFSASFYNDATIKPATGKAKVRFINMDNALGTAPITVSVDGGTGSLVPGVLFLEDSDFVEVAVGTKFNFTTTAVGVTGVTAFDAGIAADKIYTIWIDGTVVANPASHTLTGHVIVN